MKNRFVHRLFFVILGIIVLMLCSKIAFSQTYPVPYPVFDQMVFEIKKGRVCDSLANEQGLQIDLLKKAVDGGQKAIELKVSENNALQAIILNWEQAYKKSEEIYTLDKKWLRSRLNRLKKVIALEGGIIIVLVLILI